MRTISFILTQIQNPTPVILGTCCGLLLAFIFFMIKINRLKVGNKNGQSKEKILHQFFDMFNSTKVGFALYDANGYLIDINNACLDIYGITDKEQLIASKTSWRDNPNFSSLALDGRKLDSGSNVLINYDFDIVNKDYVQTTKAGKLWIINNFHKISDIKGNLEYTIVTSTDVTEDTVRNQKFERMYGTSSFLLMSLPLGATIFDCNGKQTYINDSYMDIMGISNREEFLAKGHNISLNPHMPEDKKKWMSDHAQIGYKKIIDFDDPETREYYGSRNSGKKIFSVNVARKSLETNDISIVLFSDITESENHRQIIDDMNKNMSIIIDAGGLSTWIYDVKSRRRIMCQGRRLLPENPSPDENYNNYMHPDDAAHLSKLVKGLINGESKEIKTVIRYNDSTQKGKYSYFEISWVATYEDGVPVKVACVNRDITAETLYRQDLETSKIRTVLAFKEGEMSQYDYNVQSGDIIVYHSDRLISGRSVINIDDYLSYFHPDDLKNVSDSMNKMKEGIDFSFSIKYRIKGYGDKDWQSMIMTNVPLERDSHGKVLIYTGIRRNITQWDELTNDLQKKNEMLQVILDRMPCLFFVKNINDNYKYVMANALFCKSLGKTENEILGATDYDIMETSEEADKFRMDDIEVVRYGSKTCREETSWADGHKVWHTTKTILQTASGNKFLIAMSSDITSLDNTMDELRLAREKAERSDLLKSSFLANMSHEIRTPLNSIVGFADLIANTDNEEEKEKYKKIIFNNSELLLKLISDILDMSKIEAGYIGLKNASVDIAELFEDYKKTFSEKSKKDISFECINPYKSCIIETDRDRLSQVVNNYMSNAYKYTAKGKIKLGYECINNGLRIYVEDTGIGISEENRSRVFGRFQKFDSFAQGTGLGLSICKAIADSVGGEVGFTSKKDEGSTFWIWIPCKPIIDNQVVLQPHKGRNKEDDKQHGKDAKDMRILVAEDNDSNFILIEAILKDYPIERVKNGLDAVSAAKEHKHSIIFMDLKMPVMGGLEATRKIRDFDNETPIIAITANAFDSDREDSLSAGCTMYVPKPIKSSDITKILAEVI